MDREDNSDNCGVCKKKVGERSKSILCEMCNRWYHAACERIENDLFTVLKKYKDELWFCHECKPEIRSCIQKLKYLEKQNNETQSRLKVLENKWQESMSELDKHVDHKIAKLEEKLVQNTKELPIESAEKDTQSLMQRVEENAVEKTTQRIIKELEDKEDFNRRKKNVVLYNIPESKKENAYDRMNDDLNKCHDVFRTSLRLKDTDYEIENTIRLGQLQQNGTMRPTLVVLRDVKQKWRIMTNAKNMKYETHAGKKKVGISLDLNKEQREKNKKLRDELLNRRRNGEEDITIKNGEIVKIETDHRSQAEAQWQL